VIQACCSRRSRQLVRDESPHLSLATTSASNTSRRCPSADLCRVSVQAPSGATEGELTQTRSAMVNTNTLAQLAEQLDLAAPSTG